MGVELNFLCHAILPSSFSYTRKLLTTDVRYHGRYVKRKLSSVEKWLRYAEEIMPSDFDLNKFGKRLREVRLNRKLTLKNVAKDTKISIPTLSRVERGDAKEVEGKTLLALSEWAKLPLELFSENKIGMKRVSFVPKGTATPDVVELHLRADKNLEPKTLEMLVKMFRAAYAEAITEHSE
jgi:transcriptional regulator with XRE-family HTH domain